MTVAEQQALKESELEKIRVLLHQATGMIFEKDKDAFLAGRISERMQARNIAHFDEYYQLLAFNTSKDELLSLIEGIVSEETYFFRNAPQLRGFAEKVLPKVMQTRLAKGEKKLRIWSAACATGEEPYSLAMLLRETIKDLDTWQITLLATDIDSRVLEKARCGFFPERALGELPESYRQKFFTKTDTGQRISQEIRQMVEFEQLNLVDRFALRRQRDFDIIFCRNVLIYFSDLARKKVLAGLYDALMPGGFLFLGRTESIGRITAAFTLERIDGFLCYRKPQ